MTCRMRSSFRSADADAAAAAADAAAAAAAVAGSPGTAVSSVPATSSFRTKRTTCNSSATRSSANLFYHN